MRSKFGLETGLFSWGPFQPSAPLEEAPLCVSAVGWVRFLPPSTRWRFGTGGLDQAPGHSGGCDAEVRAKTTCGLGNKHSPV